MNQQQTLITPSCNGNPSLAIQAKDIKKATANFSKEHMIGAGGFGEVYRAKLHSFGVVAIKRIKQNLIPTDDQRECQLLFQYEHINLVRLHTSLRIDGHLCMVMEFIVNGSLNSRLQAKDEILNYWVRIQICIGVAKGINYLHTAFRTYLVHRDIKTDNILLTEDYTPKICDFGLSKILSTRTDRDSTAITENIMGTRAYLPPEAYQKIISRRFDVYCYGVVLLEIISGKSAFFSDKEGYRYLVGYFHYCYKHCKSKFPIDENANWPDDFVKRLTKLAKWCLMDNYEDRPYMDKIIANLIRIASKA